VQGSTLEACLDADEVHTMPASYRTHADDIT
jgi:hypothetical protein